MNKHLPVLENETGSVLSFEFHDLVLNCIVPCTLFPNIYTKFSVCTAFSPVSVYGYTES